MATPQGVETQDPSPEYRIRATEISRAVEPLIGSCASALRTDVYEALKRACKRERYQPARQILAQLLENADIAREKRVPLCQDTGTVWVLIELDPHVALVGDIAKALNGAASRASLQAGLRASVAFDALSDRTNTTDNTPVFAEIVQSLQTDYPRGAEYVPGARVSVMLKGAGSDNASCVAMLSPADGIEAIEQLLIDQVRKKASMACPPLIIGIGIGATFDKVASLSKRALLRTLENGCAGKAATALERRLLDAVNATGIGPAALGGDTTALGVLVQTAPCHIAALPVAINLGCSALRTRSVCIPGTKVSCHE